MGKKIILSLLSLTFLSFFAFNTNEMMAYAEFDNSGNYVCNPFARSLETNIYIDTVSKINYKMEIYMKTNPLATPQEQHDVMIQDQKTWDVYSKSKECISSLGINPDSVATLDTSVQQAIAVPEFPFTIPVFLVGFISIIIFYKFQLRK